ncbi:MAG: hypothetical protein AAF661_09040 [Pseudomonadota bacterium]
MKKTLTVLALGGMFVASATIAAIPDFAVVDVNSDLAITYEELLAAMPDVTEDAFLSADANGDGVLNAEEYAALGA